MTTISIHQLAQLDALLQRDDRTMQTYKVARWAARAIGCMRFGEGDTIEQAVERALAARGSVAQPPATVDNECEDLFA